VPVEFGGLPFGGAPPEGGAPPGAVLGGVAFGAPDELAFGAVFSGALLAGAFWSDGPPGAVDCCFAQPAASISVAIVTRTKLCFMEHLSDRHERGVATGVPVSLSRAGFVPAARTAR
jgi:hypothetical protein